MFDLHTNGENPGRGLAAAGYWPAVAAKALAEGRYSRAVEVCREGLAEEGEVVSGRLIYARALYHGGQVESATEQFYQVLASDPENLVALKYLGDIKYAGGEESSARDECAAMAHYRRVLELDPHCRELCCTIEWEGDETKREATRTITLKREGESLSKVKERGGLRPIVFYTETMGDLYLAQGHNRLAAEVYRDLYGKSPSPKLKEKLERAEKRGRE